MTQERNPYTEQEKFQHLADRAAEAAQGHKDFKKTSKYWPDRSQEHKDIHNNRIRMWVQERDKYQAMADALNPTSDPELDPETIPETIPELDLESDSDFWEEVEKETPPPEERNAGDIIDIIDKVVEEREGPININSNEVTADQSNKWETIANIVGNDNVTDLSVDNRTTIDNENIFDVADSEYSDGNAFNGNFSRLDVDQNNQWKTNLGIYGDGNITDASVSNIMDINNSNAYDGSGFSGWDINDLIDEPEETKLYIPENSPNFIDKWVNGEKNGTVPTSYIRDESDIGTGFLERFKNKLLTKILDR